MWPTKFFTLNLNYSSVALDFPMPNCVIVCHGVISKFWKTIWSLPAAYRDQLSTWDPWHKFHLSSFNRHYYNKHRKNNGIPIWHSVKKNDVKIATIGWQLHCVQADNSNKAPTIMKFHASIWQKNLFCLTGNVLTPKILCSHICRWIHSVYKAKSAVREIS